MTVDDLASQLFAVAEQQAQLAGRHLGEGADSDLRDLTLTAASTLLTIADQREQQSEIARAESELRRLIDMALENVKKLENYPDDLLGEHAYFPARLRFCPCRPFC